MYSNNPANICWSSTRLQRNNFLSSKTSWRRLEDVSKTLCKDVLKTSWKTKNLYAEDIFKTWLEEVSNICLEDVFKTSSRQNVYWGYLYETYFRLQDFCCVKFNWIKFSKNAAPVIYEWKKTIIVTMQYSYKHLLCFQYLCVGRPKHRKVYCWLVAPENSNH